MQRVLIKHTMDSRGGKYDGSAEKLTRKVEQSVPNETKGPNTKRKGKPKRSNK